MEINIKVFVSFLSMRGKGRLMRERKRNIARTDLLFLRSSRPRCKSALLCVRDHDVAYPIYEALNDRGYFVEHVETPEAVLAEKEQRDYDWCLIDVDFGNSRGVEMDVAHQLYNSDGNKVRGGRSNLLVVSSDDDVVDMAEREGLPAVSVKELSGSYEELF